MSRKSWIANDSTTQSSVLSTRYLFSQLTAGLLRDGYSVRFRAVGKSMHPTIKEGEELIVEPVAPSDVKVADIILYQNHKSVIAHRVVAIEKVSGNGSSVRPQSSALSPHHSAGLSNEVRAMSGVKQTAMASAPQSSVLIAHYLFVLRGDASTSCDKPVKPPQILGKVVAAKRDGRRVNLGSKGAKMLYRARLWNSRLRRAVRYLRITTRSASRLRRAISYQHSG